MDRTKRLDARQSEDFIADARASGRRAVGSAATRCERRDGPPPRRHRGSTRARRSRARRVENGADRTARWPAAPLGCDPARHRRRWRNLPRGRRRSLGRRRCSRIACSSGRRRRLDEGRLKARHPPRARTTSGTSYWRTARSCRLRCGRPRRSSGRPDPPALPPRACRGSRLARLDRERHSTAPSRRSRRPGRSRARRGGARDREGDRSALLADVTG